MTAVACSLWLLSVAVAADAPAEALRLTADCEVRFATVEQGRQVLTTDDAFTNQLSRFDLQCRLKTGKDVALDDWKEFVSKHVRSWERNEINAVSMSIERLHKRLQDFRLPLPPVIQLVRTTGDEESNAAYTRSSSIVLPAKVMNYDETKLDRLLLHELFHIMSRHDGALRAKLYAIIGFELCDSIELPTSLAARRITNPDAPLIDCVIRLIVKAGKRVTGAPILYAATKQYDAQKGATLFQSMQFRLLVVEERGDRWQPVLFNGEPVVINPRQEQEFLDKIGKNTTYIIHPDEILADNFVRLVMKDENIPSPKITEQMLRVLTPR
jgi:hypothetical protein